MDAPPLRIAATVIFLAAVLHTFAASWFTRKADELQRTRGRQSVAAGILHFFGEVEVVFGLWTIPLMVAMIWLAGLDAAQTYLNGTVDYTEALFVVVIMTIASTQPVVAFAGRLLGFVAGAGGRTPAAWWVALLTVGPLMGSLITEPAAMTICALLLAEHFFELQPSTRLKFATLGLLFVNVSIGGTLTHFAAPPVLMVARSWNWDTPFMLAHFGARAVAGILAGTLVYFLLFRTELTQLARRVDEPESDQGPAIPFWITAVHLGFMAWTVFNAHYPALFVGGFLFFLGFTKATSAFQGEVDLRPPMMVGFFLAGLVIHGGLQGWWITPVLGRLSEAPLFATSVALTAFNDNALITYLATLVPNLDESLKTAIVQGAVAGGGLTVIANAPNPAGQALLGRYFDGAVAPLRLLLGAALPTAAAICAFRLF